MKIGIFICAIVLIIAVGIANVAADDDDYHYMSVCDNRCEIRHRVNPFAEGCDECCRQRGFRKGKCKGFGWAYCMCKPHNQIRTLLSNILQG